LNFKLLKSIPKKDFCLFNTDRGSAHNGKVAGVQKVDYLGQMKQGDHKITVESRYGYVEAWVDDEFIITNRNQFLDYAKFREYYNSNTLDQQFTTMRDRIIDTIMASVNKLLNNLEQNGIIQVS